MLVPHHRVTVAVAVAVTQPATELTPSVKLLTQMIPAEMWREGIAFFQAR